MVGAILLDFNLFHEIMLRRRAGNDTASVEGSVEVLGKEGVVEEATECIVIKNVVLWIPIVSK